RRCGFFRQPLGIGLVGQRGDDGDDVRAVRLELGRAGDDIVLRTRADGERGTLRSKRAGNRLSYLSVVADAGDDGNLALEIGWHLNFPVLDCALSGTSYTMAHVPRSSLQWEREHK